MAFVYDGDTLTITAEPFTSGTISPTMFAADPNFRYTVHGCQLFSSVHDRIDLRLGGVIRATGPAPTINTAPGYDGYKLPPGVKLHGKFNEAFAITGTTGAHTCDGIVMIQKTPL